MTTTTRSRSRLPLLVLEQTGVWARVLRRELAGSELRVRELRLLDDLEAELAAAPGSMTVVECSTVGAPQLPARLAAWRDRDPQGCAAVAVDRADAAWEWLLREAGAVHVVCSTRRAGELARIAIRHAARLPGTEEPFARAVWDSLPWGTHQPTTTPLDTTSPGNP